MYYKYQRLKCCANKTYNRLELDVDVVVAKGRLKETSRRVVLPHRRQTVDQLGWKRLRLAHTYLQIHTYLLQNLNI